jgi:mono/diheme cytochrome c family protein
MVIIQLGYLRNTKREMMKKIALISIVAIVLIFFATTYLSKKDETNRWYTKDQVNFGKEVFAQNCAVCHGYKAEKTINWKQTLSDGSYPPPPLNDKAHAWHHPYSQLSEIINNGGKSYGGKMPSFKDKLTQDEIDAAIAYFQSFWDDEHYGYWSEVNK